MAIVSEDLKKLKIIKKIMESDLFYRYISSTTKDYASGYISMSRNYLKNFGVFQFSESEEEDLLNSGNPDDLLKQFYNI
jgi:adenine-specific DNA-methyltransferase